MSLAELVLTDFRNHASARLQAAPRFNLLVGDNGAGKTNVLEAISLLAPGMGLRGAALGEMARIGGSGGFAVAAQQQERDGGARIGVGTLAGAPDRRLVRINGARTPATALAERIAVAWLTPAMDRLWSGPPSGRRRFLDRLTLAMEPGHATEATRYEAAMRQRNRLLAASGTPDPVWLAAIEARMAAHGAAVASARARTVDALAALLAGDAEGPFVRPVLALLPGEPWGEDLLASRLLHGRAQDRAAGRTLAGPHRDDLAVRLASSGMAAAQCSTGEQKALLVAVLLAHAQLVRGATGRPLMLLLDEVAAHLDAGRRAALFERLEGIGVQCWLTGTDAQLFAALPADAAIWKVSGAGIVPVAPDDQWTVA